NQALAYTAAVLYSRCMKEFKTLPDQSSVKEARAKLPDPDGWVAAALKDYDPAGYQPGGEIAAVGNKRTRRVAIRNVAYNPDDDTPPGGLAFTKYTHRLPGDDKILGTEDDWIVRDGIVSKVAGLQGEKNRARTQHRSAALAVSCLVTKRKKRRDALCFFPLLPNTGRMVDGRIIDAVSDN